MAQTFQQLVARVRSAGFDEDGIKEHILPDWWDESCESDPALLPEVEFRVARAFGVSLEIVRDPAERLPKPLMAPTLASNKIHSANLSGAYFPWEAKERLPVFLFLPLSNYIYLACFRSKELLVATLTQAKATWDEVRQIADGPGFLRSFPREIGDKPVRVILDPTFTAERRIYYLEAVWD